MKDLNGMQVSTMTKDGYLELLSSVVVNEFKPRLPRLRPKRCDEPVCDAEAVSE